MTLIKLLSENPELADYLRIPDKEMPMRLWYMFHHEIYAVIDVDEQKKKVKVYNFTENFIQRPFDRIENPNFEQYESFLESRCFQRERDKMKLILRDRGLPFYEPL